MVFVVLVGLFKGDIFGSSVQQCPNHGFTYVYSDSAVLKPNKQKFNLLFPSIPNKIKIILKSDP